MRERALAVVLIAAMGAIVACGTTGSAGSAAIRIGAIFPLSAGTEPLAGEELLGVTIAEQLVNQDGGIDGRLLSLDVRDVNSVAAAQSAADSLRRDGVPAVLGAYSSELSIPASGDVARDGMLYWESGAVADQVTGQGLPLVFRIGANGSDLRGKSGRFVAEQIAPRLHRSAASLRVFLVTAGDAYGHSVADGARAALNAAGVPVVDEAVYNPYAPVWQPVLQAIAATRPDILILSSHIPDGIAFRRAFLAAGLHVDAFLGSSMAQCMDDFGDALGPQAVGVFASDRPQANFNPGALDPSARRLYERFAAAWRAQHGGDPTEEGIAGFTAAWVLFHDVMPAAVSLTPTALAAAARALDLPAGSLTNGAGVLFGSSARLLGQNLRAAAVIWQWQAVRRSVVVWPATYATGKVIMVPLPA
jgi:branched-chain amino acid transport system substrate-binding protein